MITWVPARRTSGVQICKLALDPHGLKLLFSPLPLSFTKSHLRPGCCIKVRTVTTSLFWSPCLTGGFVLHVWWGLLCAAEPWLLTFLPGSEGLTVPLALDEGEPASPWWMLFYSRWQLWQPVMAAGWWESQAFLPPPVLPCPSAPDRCFTWRTWNPREPFFLWRLDCGTMQW